MGELDGSRSERVVWLSSKLEEGGVAAPILDNVRGEIFLKAVNSLALNLVAVRPNPPALCRHERRDGLVESHQ